MFYLASRLSDTEFSGIDLPNGQLDMAFKKCQSLSNCTVYSGDYHNLSRFGTDSFDLVYAIEALSYSQHKDTVLKEAKRILRPSGLLIIIDGYAGKDRDNFSKIEEIAFKLAEKGMMLPVVEYYNDLQKKIDNSRMKIIFEEDVTKFIKPTLDRLCRHSKWLFQFPWLGRIIVRILPSEVFGSAVSAYLMPEFGAIGLGKYYITVIQKG